MSSFGVDCNPELAGPSTGPCTSLSESRAAIPAGTSEITSYIAYLTAQGRDDDADLIAQWPDPISTFLQNDVQVEYLAEPGLPGPAAEMPGAPPEVVKPAYRTIAHQHHPDRGG